MRKLRSVINWNDSGLTLYEAFSLPPRAIIDQKQIGFLLTQGPFFESNLRLRKRAFDAPSVYKKNRTTFVVRFAFGRDSVGIRTQDPQLRRLLLYPTELPNRSVVFRLDSEPKTHSLEGCCSRKGSYPNPKVDCKGSDFFRICKLFISIFGLFGFNSM